MIWEKTPKTVFFLLFYSMKNSASPGSIDVEAVDVEGEQRNHVRQQRQGKGEAQAGGQAPVPQNGLNEGRHEVDVA